MKQTAIFWPTLALILVTFLVLVQVPIRRFRAAFAGRVTAADFKYGESGSVPADVALPNRMFMNLVEVPVLFYVVCLIYFVTAQVDANTMVMAWLYFALRMVHCFVYMTYNNVVHRFAVFATSNVVVVCMVMYLAWLLSH
jgi:hypothetical protein